MKTNIAIAGDHQQLRTGLVSLLTQKGFHVSLAAANGAELIELLKTYRPFPDICIVDFRMPSMDGVATTEYIKKNWPFINVVVYSMAESEDARMRAIGAGADKYVFKGAHINELYVAIDECRGCYLIKN